MQPQLIKSTLFFQQLLSSRFRTLKERVVKTIMLLSLCHLFRLYNPNQVSDLYRKRTYIGTSTK